MRGRDREREKDRERKRERRRGKGGFGVCDLIGQRLDALNVMHARCGGLTKIARGYTRAYI